MAAWTLFLQIGRRLGIYIEYRVWDKRLPILLLLSNDEYLVEFCIRYYSFLIAL